MKILILSFYYEPDLCAGSFRTTAFAKALKNLIGARDSIEIITTLPNRYHSFQVETPAEELNDNIFIRRIKVPVHKSGFFDQVKSFTVYFYNVLKFVRNKDYDVIFATSSRLLTAFLGALISRWKGIPLYLDIRDIFIDTLHSVLVNSKLKYFIPFFHIIENYTVNAAGKVNLVSRGFASYYQNKFNKEYSFFTNGIDDDFIGNHSISMCNTHKEKLVFTYTGNVGEGQGLDKIVYKIAETFHNIEFVIIGDGGRIKALKESVKHLSNVKVLKPMSRSELIGYYQKSDVLFLHLNDYDAFKKVLPSKIFEYAAMCKPIMAGVDGYAKEFLEENIPDAMIFHSCDFDDFCSKYSMFAGIVNMQQRMSFISKFSRRSIMSEMAGNFLEFHDKSIRDNSSIP